MTERDWTDLALPCGQCHKRHYCPYSWTDFVNGLKEHVFCSISCLKIFDRRRRALYGYGQESRRTGLEKRE